MSRIDCGDEIDLFGHPPRRQHKAAKKPYGNHATEKGQAHADRDNKVEHVGKALPPRVIEGRPQDANGD
jgi:hypothetical protein